MRELAWKLVILDIGTDLVSHLSSMRQASLIGRAFDDNVLVARRTRNFSDRGLG
jgi:hypothetical protein